MLRSVTRQLLRCSLGAALMVALSGCLYGDVVRVIDGVEVPGRFISDVAYAAYARGAELEAREQYDAALVEYSAAAARDPQSVEVWTRVGAMRCRLGRADAAIEAFDRAEERGASYEPLWRERAICAERRGDLKAAAAHARRAVASDPERDETVLLYARLVALGGDSDEASRWLHALSLRSPHARAVWLAIMDHARNSGDEAWYAHAHARLDALSDKLGHVVSEQANGPWTFVDAALVRGDLPAARRHIRQARLDPRWLPARAIALGQPALAQADATLRVGADPLDSDARVALALATDLLGKGAAAGDTLAALPGDAEALSEVGRVMLAELLGRHVGEQATLAWMGHEPLVHAVSGDARGELIVRLRARLDGKAAAP